MRKTKKKDTFEGLCSQAHNLRRKLTELNDETTNTRQQLSVVLSSIETFSANINVELNQSRDEFGVKPEWF